MPKPQTRPQHSLSPSLLAFKPRQLLLANRNPQMKPTNSTQKGPLLYAVARFLEANGFSKTLKKFLSEAPIEKNGMKESSLDLGDMYCKYSEMCNKDKTSVDSQDDGKDPEEVKKPEQVEVANKNKEKKKKKGNIVSDTPGGVEQHKLELLSGEVVESLKDHTSVKGKGDGDTKTEKKSKDMTKKKSKSKDYSVTPDVEQGGMEAKQDANGTVETVADESVEDVKPKAKKNKKESSGGEDKKVVPVGDAGDAILKKEDFKTSDVDATDDKENKSSKKRKRLDSEGNDSEPGKSKEDESAEKSSMKKSVKKQRNDSTEPKTAKTAFQRVKLEEVVFTDEKLKDNSYWAKDGADIGYGAKAQEILGQVRGKDFRHEKTKKKRGSYRGGQIDLQSHSVKFNYSDED